MFSKLKRGGDKQIENAELLQLGSMISDQSAEWSDHDLSRQRTSQTPSKAIH